MTTVEVAYRCGQHPSEEAMRALGYVREVYGVRRVTFSINEGTVRVEYDATRLNKSNISRLLRGAGLALAEEISPLNEAQAAV
jgi:copper chaperone CopZ